jgi:hypothetical protein
MGKNGRISKITVDSAKKLTNNIHIGDFKSDIIQVEYIV